MRSTIALVLPLLLLPLPAATAEQEEEPKILGRTTVEALREEPYSEWFTEGYDAYAPNPEFVARLRAAEHESASITVFFGTWCPDSRREVPRLIKLLDEIEFSRDRLTLVAVDHTEEANHQSPGGEEKGFDVFRVPTIVVARDGSEVARLVEHPVLSQERDLLAIFSGEPYRLNFPAYPVIQQWLADGLLSDPNISPDGLAGLVQPQIRSEFDLIGAGKVLQARGQTAEAVMLHRVNCALHRTSSRAHEELARALRAAGEKDEAREAAEKAIRLNTDPQRVGSLVELVSDDPAEQDKP